MNDIIPEDTVKILKDRFGSRFVQHAVGEAAPGAKDTVASVYPQSIGEVESLTRLAARHSIPLVARGAGTAIYPGKPPRGLTVRFDAMRQIRIPEGEEENWVEVEPGVTWWTLELRLRERGMGPRVYPTSAPRSTVGGWLAENGIGVGSYECGWLLRLAASKRPLGRGRCSWRRTEHHRRQRGFEALRRVQRQHGAGGESVAHDETCEWRRAGSCPLPGCGGPWEGRHGPR